MKVIRRLKTYEEEVEEAKLNNSKIIPKG